MKVPDGYVSVSQAAEILGITSMAVRYRIKAGDLTPHRYMGHVVLDEQEVRSFGQVRPMRQDSSPESPDAGESDGAEPS